MKNKIIILFTFLLAFTFTFASPVHAANREEVVVIDHSQDHLKNRVYTPLEIEAASRKIQEIRERDADTDRLRQQDRAFHGHRDLSAPQAVSISAVSGTFYDEENVFGRFTLLGEVINNGTTTAIYAKIRVKLYGSGGSLLNTYSTYIMGGKPLTTLYGTFTRGLPGKYNGFFQINSGVDYSKVSYYTYTFEYDTYSYTYAKAYLMFDDFPRASKNVFSKVKYNGTVKNIDNTHLTYYSKLYLASYNHDGKVIALNSTYLGGDFGSRSRTIYPGDTESFEINSGALWGHYSTYDYYFEWGGEDKVKNAPTKTLTVQSTPSTGATIDVSPSDNNSKGDGSTNFTRTYDEYTTVTLIAPSTHNGKTFSQWKVDGVADTAKTISVLMSENHTVVAEYDPNSGPPVYTLTVQSSPTTGASVTVSPADVDGNGNGSTNFTRSYTSGTAVTLTAPGTLSGKYFSKWNVGGTDKTSSSVTVTMTGNVKAIAYYSATPPEIAVNRNALYFSYVLGGAMPKPQTFNISNSGGGELNWSIGDASDLSCSPDSGSGGGIVTVTLDPTGLAAGNYYGELPITCSGASNSPLTVTAYLTVINASQNQAPFGQFATPADGANVSSSIAVTGWVLDDTGIDSVKIYRENGGSLAYIGDAVFVEGARDDVEAAYPGYPAGYKAGWGYMLLTHFMPNNGNGTFVLHAIATDMDGKSTDLGSKTIHIDNANAAKPFGAIDTPGQGGTASGAKFINWGWALTPQPKSIATDGSTIKVFVDGAYLGTPNYNVYRADIAGLFPGLANTDGAIGYFFLDTTAYENGVHTISWNVKDNQGVGDGIGSRYFSIVNSGSSRTAANSGTLLKPHFGDINARTASKPSVSLKEKTILDAMQSNNQIQTIRSAESQRVVINLNNLWHASQGTLAETSYTGYLYVGGRLLSLPVGSTLKPSGGMFYWGVGPAFTGTYQLVFTRTEADGSISTRSVMVEIGSGFELDKKIKTHINQ